MLVRDRARVAQGNDGCEAAVERFLNGLLESDLVVSDLHERNIVYACGPDRARTFVMIDGLGCSNLLLFKSWFRSVNRRSKEKRVARLRRRISLRVAAFLEGKPMT